MKYDLNKQETKLLQAWHMKTLMTNYEGNVWGDQEKRMVNSHVIALKKLGIAVTSTPNNRFLIEGH